MKEAEFCAEAMILLHWVYFVSINSRFCEFRESLMNVLKPPRDAKVKSCFGNTSQLIQLKDIPFVILEKTTSVLITCA
jgi:hypothetical protein